MPAAGMRDETYHPARLLAGHPPSGGWGEPAFQVVPVHSAALMIPCPMLWHGNQIQPVFGQVGMGSRVHVQPA